MCTRRPDHSKEKTCGAKAGAARLRAAICCLWIGLLLALGCRQQMEDQPRIEPLEEAAFFVDRMGARQAMPGTIARGHRRDEIISHSRHYSSGMVDGEVADALPAEIVEDPEFQLRELLIRGRERYEIFCSHCHDLTGTGLGTVPRRGFPQPPTFHSHRLRQMPLGHFFRVITDGRGKMPAHGSQVPPGDRWAIAAYVRALQFSQHAEVPQLPESDKKQLELLNEEPAP